MADKPSRTDKRDRNKPTGWPRPKTQIARQIGLNPLRMAALVALALSGVFGGYFIGKYLNPAEPTTPPQAEAPKSEAPQSPVETAEKPYSEPHLHEEEALPRDIIIQRGGVLKRIALPEPDQELDFGNGANGKPATQEAIKPETPPPAVDQPQTPKQTAPTPKVQLARAMPDNLAALQSGDSSSLPRWLRHAVPVQDSGKPAVVIVMDDMGLNRSRARRTADLPGPLTLSFLSYADGLESQFKAAKAKGHELMLHVPMEPRSQSIDPGPNVLLSGIPRDELVKNIAWNLDQVEGYVGINNHMGSRFTADIDGMLAVTDALKARGLLFLDSVTSGRSVAHDIAQESGIPFAVRNVFLDHEDDFASIQRQLRTLERIAKKTGLAIAIGHPRPNTLKALEEWLPKLDEKGLQLVPISAAVQISADG